MTAVIDAAAPSSDAVFMQQAAPAMGENALTPATVRGKNFQKSKNNSPKAGEAEKIFKNRKTIPVLPRRGVPVMFLCRWKTAQKSFFIRQKTARPASRRCCTMAST